MPDANGTQKCWQRIMMGLLGVREVTKKRKKKKRTFAWRKSSTVQYIKQYAVMDVGEIILTQHVFGCEAY